MFPKLDKRANRPSATMVFDVDHVLFTFVFGQLDYDARGLKDNVQQIIHHPSTAATFWALLNSLSKTDNLSVVIA